MLDNDFLDKIFENNQNDVEERISKIYHERVKKIENVSKEEKENIKQGIIAELYYKEGFKDGIRFISSTLKN